MGYVRVTNGTGELIEGRYDGDDYAFPPGEPVDIPEIVAAHVFGYGHPSKLTAFARLGWLTTSDQIKTAHAKLNQVKIEAVEMIGRIVDEEELTPTSDMVPERIGTVSPNAAAGGTAGGGSLLPPPKGPIGASIDVI